MRDNMIRFYDTSGNEMYVTKEKYIETILPHNIQQSWHNSDKLYQLIVMSLTDEIYQEMIKPAKRLKAIDTIPERAYTILGIVYMKNNQLKKAEKILKKYCRKYEETGSILTNLAKVYYEMGNEALGITTLEKAIQLDPNQDNGLAWYLSILNQKYDKAYVQTVLETLCEQPEAWRPRLYLGSNKLADGQLEEGYDIFQSIIEDKHIYPESLKVIAGELGKAKLYEEALELLEPIYNIQKHDVATGLNMLNIYYHSRHYKSALILIDKLRNSGRVDLYKYLDEYREKIEREQE